MKLLLLKFEKLLSALYSETLVKKELVREVEMNPFKHIVDDGLDLRKAAFECMYTVCERCIDRIDVDEYASFVENGLKDQHDIQLLTFLILIRLSQKSAAQVGCRIDQVCELIKPILRMQPKQNAVKQKNEKQGELKQSAMKMLLAFKKVPGQEHSSQLITIMELIRDKPELSAMLSTVEQENSSGGGMLR